MGWSSRSLSETIATLHRVRSPVPLTGLMAMPVASAAHAMTSRTAERPRGISTTQEEGEAVRMSKAISLYL